MTSCLEVVRCGDSTLSLFVVVLQISAEFSLRAAPRDPAINVSCNSFV